MGPAELRVGSKTLPGWSGYGNVLKDRKVDKIRTRRSIPPRLALRTLSCNRRGRGCSHRCLRGGRGSAGRCRSRSWAAGWRWRWCCSAYCWWCRAETTWRDTAGPRWTRCTAPAVTEEREFTAFIQRERWDRLKHTPPVCGCPGHRRKTTIRLDLWLWWISTVCMRNTVIWGGGLCAGYQEIFLSGYFIPQTVYINVVKQDFIQHKLRWGTLSSVWNCSVIKTNICAAVWETAFMSSHWRITFYSSLPLIIKTKR